MPNDVLVKVAHELKGLTPRIRHDWGCQQYYGRHHRKNCVGAYSVFSVFQTSTTESSRSSKAFTCMSPGVNQRNTAKKRLGERNRQQFFFEVTYTQDARHVDAVA